MLPYYLDLAADLDKTKKKFARGPFFLKYIQKEKATIIAEKFSD